MPKLVPYKKLMAAINAIDYHKESLLDIDPTQTYGLTDKEIGKGGNIMRGKTRMP